MRSGGANYRDEDRLVHMMRIIETNFSRWRARKVGYIVKAMNDL